MCFRDCEAWKCENSCHVVTSLEELQQVFEYSNEEWRYLGKWMGFSVIGVRWFSWQSSWRFEYYSNWMDAFRYSCRVETDVTVKL